MSRATSAKGGCERSSTGTSSRLPAQSASENRSKRRKLPVLAAAITAPAAARMPHSRGRPR